MNQTLERQLNVVTPEQVQLNYQTAGIGSRAGAQIIDWLLLVVFYALMFGATAGVLALADINVEKGQTLIALVLIIVFIVQYGYFWLMEFFEGRTIGKRVVGLRVIQENGQPLTFLSAALRNLFRVLDMLPLMYLVGMLASFFHSHDKRLGDMVAGTVVVYDEGLLHDKKRRQMEKTISRGWRQIPLSLSAEQRQCLRYEDWSMLSLFIEQLPGYSMRERDQLALRLAKHLREKLGLLEEVRTGFGETPFLISLYKEIRSDWEIQGSW